MSPNYLDTNGYRLLLGSRSPRRREILESMCLPFEVVDLSVDESFDASLKGGKSVAEYLARKKSEGYVSDLGPKDILITSDTVVVHRDKIINKASDAQDAVEMILDLMNSRHEVVSAVCMRGPDRTSVFSESTKVTFGPLDREEISWYVDRFKPFDKAGAYGIQEWIGYVGIEAIEGSYYNVMGFPTRSFYKELKKWISH